MSVSPWMQPVLWWCVVVFQLQFWQKIWYKLLFSPWCIVLWIGPNIHCYSITLQLLGVVGELVSPTHPQVGPLDSCFRKQCLPCLKDGALPGPCFVHLASLAVLAGSLTLSSAMFCVLGQPNVLPLGWPGIGSTSTVACVVCLNYLQLKWPPAYWKQQGFRTNVLVPECSKVALFLGTFFVFLDKRFGKVCFV
jgi:hypothetical protein